MKICFITATLAGGGAERVIANLANEMCARGHQITILLTTEKVVEYSLNEQIEVIQISNKTAHGMKERISRVSNLRKYFMKHKDSYYISMPTDTNIFVLFASLFLNINLVISERNDPNQYEHRPIRNVLYCFANKIVFQTKDASLCFSKRLQRQGKIILNPVSETLPMPYIGTREKRIVAVGRLDTQKNHKLLINAFSCFIKEHPEYQLDIYGRGPLQEALTIQIKEMDLVGKVQLRGFSKDVWSEASNAMMYVLSSDYEGMPNSLLEAMAMGMAVISTDCPIGGAAMLIEHQVNGLLVPVDDCEKLYQAMRFLVNNPDVAERYSKEAMKTREQLSVKRICDEWLEYILG